MSLQSLDQFLRRRAAPALLIQKPDFQTISCSCVRKKRAKHRMYLRRSRTKFTTVIFSVDFQGAEEKCVLRRKERFAGTLKKLYFFDFVIIQIVLDYAVLEQYEAHYSRPRTYLTSRSGATHALRVLSSLYRKVLKES